jgi:hypothetical protein
LEGDNADADDDDDEGPATSRTAAASTPYLAWRVERLKKDGCAAWVDARSSTRLFDVDD